MRFLLIFCTLILYSNGIALYASVTGTATSNCTTAQNPCSSITAAVRLATDGDVIHLLNGEFTGALNRDIQINKSLTFVGQSDQVNIDLQELGRAFSLSNDTITFTMQQITISNGFASSGGALFLQGPAAVTINNCTFNNNSATVGGALAFAQGSTVVITDCLFLSNSAHDEGGSIVFDEILWATVRDSFFVESLSLDGGAIYIASSAVNITTSSFLRNYADDQGGSVFSTQASRVLLDNCLFLNNTGYSEGGTIYSVASSLVTITNSNITHSIGFSGGAISADTYGGVKIISCTLNQNSALNGGAVFVGSGRFTSIESQIIYNSALQYSGAIFVADEGKVDLRSTFITNNNANSDGGAIYTKTRSVVYLSDTTISENSAGGSGGGIYCSNSKIHINGSTISDNTAEEYSDSANLFCSSFPGGTSCKIDGDSKYSAELCGLPPAGSPAYGGLPLLAIIGIALGGSGMIICFVLLIGCIIWKRKAPVDTKAAAWKHISIPKKTNEDTELLEDYD